SASSRPYSGLPDLTYPLHDRDVLVTDCGRICMHRKRVNISTVLAGQRLGIKEVDDGIWIVSFMHYDLGFIDLEQKTLQPLDNPFGTGLSPCLRYVLLPMSPVRTEPDLVLLIGFGSQIGFGMVGRFADPSIKIYWALAEPASGFGITSTAAFSVSNHRLP
ncbi:MAG TPA: hypothetical protein VHT21_06180, partial [Stellaceae bacterium]|nr:hypothetical protein [Stellaceae bacterium]